MLLTLEEIETDIVLSRKVTVGRIWKRVREREREKWNTFNTKFVLLGSPSLLTQTCSSSNQLKVKLPCLIADRGQHLGKFPFSLLTPPPHSTSSNIQVLKSFKCLVLSTTAEQGISRKILTLKVLLILFSLFKADFIPVSTSAYRSLIHIIMGFNIWAG